MLDSFWNGDERSFHDIAGMSQSTLTGLPDAPSHAKAAFAWRAVNAITRTLGPRVNQPGHVPDQGSAPGASSQPVIVTGSSSMSARALADALAGKPAPVSLSSSEMLAKIGLGNLPDGFRGSQDLFDKVNQASIDAAKENKAVFTYIDSLKECMPFYD